MMNEVISVHDCDLDLIDSDGLSHYVVTANVADMRLVRPAILYPADLAEPAEYGPGTCSAVFGVDLGEEEPPTDPVALRQYIQDLDLDWELDED
tara:strand:+ start:242 stop:523 length:282 start_codon:yes stop_codon:yes gene_type:complete